MVGVLPVVVASFVVSARRSYDLSNYGKDFYPVVLALSLPTQEPGDAVLKCELGQPILDQEGAEVHIDETALLPVAPAMTNSKFFTMQGKRVVVTIRYSEGSSLKPYFLTVAKKLKASHPDVIIERKTAPLAESDSGEETFEVLVDGKIVVGKGRARKQKVARVDMSHARSVFISMQEVDLAISRARRRRRPSTLYGNEEENGQPPLPSSVRYKAWKD